MKKSIIILGMLAIAAAPMYAQDDVQKAAADAAAAIANAPAEAAPAPKPNYWKKTARLDLGFNQTSLNNWAAGGYNTLTLSAGLDCSANYKKGLMSWNNRLQMNYAFLHSADKKGAIQKSNDLLKFDSTWGYDFATDSHWKYTASYNFRSQFTDTPAKYVQDGENGPWKPDGLKSGFISPAYNNIALGMEWKPTSWFDVNIAPLTGSFTVVTNEILRKGYGMKLACAEDDAEYLAAVAAGKELGGFYRNALFQFGASVKVNAKAALNDKFTYDTQLLLFTDYLSNPFKYTRVNWDNNFAWNATKFFKVGLNTWMIYDPLVTIDGVASKVQFKEYFLIAFTYTFVSKK